MTVLDYVVQTMLSNENKREYTEFPKDLAKLKDATKCSPSVLTNSIKMLAKGMKHMQREAEHDETNELVMDSTFSKRISAFLTKFGHPKLQKYQQLVEECHLKCFKLREHFGEDEKCDVVQLFDVLDKFSSAFALSVKKTAEKKERKRRMSLVDAEKRKKKESRRASRSPERRGREGKEGKEEGGENDGKGREGKAGKTGKSSNSRRSRSSRSPGRRSRGSSVEGKSSSGGSGGGGGSLLAAIMAKGGIGGLKQGIALNSASPGTKARHELKERLMAELLTMGHEREDVRAIASEMMDGKSTDYIARILESNIYEKLINTRLDEINRPKVMSASEKRVAMLNAMMAGRK